MSSTGLATAPSTAVGGRWRARALGAALAIVLLAAAGYATYVGLHLTSRIGATRTEIPGQRTVELAAGKYIIYYEPAAEYSQNEAFSPPSSLRIKISSPGGQELSLSRYGGEMYTGNTGSRGEAIDTVEVPHPGRYVISTTGAIGPESGTVVLGVPQGTAIIRLVIAALVAVLAFIALLISASSFWRSSGYARGNGGQLAAIMSGPWRTPGFALDPGASPLAPEALQPALNGDPLDRLAALAALRDRGVLTTEEFDAQKRRVLGTDGASVTGS